MIPTCAVCGDPIDNTARYFGLPCAACQNREFYAGLREQAAEVVGDDGPVQEWPRDLDRYGNLLYGSDRFHDVNRCPHCGVQGRVCDCARQNQSRSSSVGFGGMF
jgi:DNA-directed RNA polymerase subunit RPC12/RpoP